MKKPINHYGFSIHNGSVFYPSVSLSTDIPGGKAGLLFRGEYTETLKQSFGELFLLKSSNQIEHS